MPRPLFNPNLPPHPVTNPHPNPNHPSNVLHPDAGRGFNPNLPPDPETNPHPNPRHQTNLPHPHLSPFHPRNDPNHLENQPRFSGSTTGATDPHTFEPISVDVPETGNRDNPEVKVLQHEDKQIILSPDGIFMIAAGTTVSLSDAEGVTIISDGDINLQSGKETLIAAGEEISIVGMAGVELESGTASVTLEEDVLIEGSEIKEN